MISMDHIYIYTIAMYQYIPEGHYIWLVVSTPLKNMKVNGKDDIPYTMEKKTCLKPPTSQANWCLSHLARPPNIAIHH